MIPVTQTRTGKRGTCMSACIASILELPVESVPYFGDEDEEFYRNLGIFLKDYGLFYIQLKPDDPILNLMFQIGPVWHTMEGISPRGAMHACVGLNRQLIHDPHPQDGTGRGLRTLEHYGLLCARLDR